MAIYQTNGKGEQFAYTSVRVPRSLFDAARSQGVNLSQAMTETLDGIVGPGRTPRK